MHHNGVYWCYCGDGETSSCKISPRKACPAKRNLAGQDRPTGRGLLPGSAISATIAMLVELIEQGIEAQQQKEKAFFQLAECFRAASDPEQVKQLGDQLGRFVFGE